MGYYTRHEIQIYGQDTYLIVDALKNICREDDRLFNQPIKWYTHKEDCLKVSAQHPDHLFSIYGYGEDEDGLWREDYYGGEMVSQWEFEGIPDMDAQAFLVAQNHGV